MSRIDRIFCTTSFEALIPLAHARAFPRLGSDHTPIIWDDGTNQHKKK
jgi:endonuclease/exonuclease/phosphatase family metal-dependent hydrolase